MVALTGVSLVCGSSTSLSRFLIAADEHFHHLFSGSSSFHSGRKYRLVSAPSGLSPVGDFECSASPGRASSGELLHTIVSILSGIRRFLLSGVSLADSFATLVAVNGRGSAVASKVLSVLGARCKIKHSIEKQSADKYTTCCSVLSICSLLDPSCFRLQQ